MLLALRGGPDPEHLAVLGHRAPGDHDGVVREQFSQALVRVGALGVLGIDQFLAPHGLCVDSRCDVYVGEVSWTQWPNRFPNEPSPDNLRSLRKFRRLG